MALPRIVIIGGGFGGLNVATRLARFSGHITLIDKMNHHLFQPLLYQVASAALSPADIATPLREILRDQKNTTVIMGDVVHIDKEGKKVKLSCSKEFPYDYLVVATGARHSYFGHDEWEAFAPGLKTVTDALTIRERILMSFEKAERMDNIAEAEKYLHFIIIGGGPTGVEMAGSIAEIAQKTMFRNFRRIHPEKSQIYLIEGSSRLLPPFPPSLSKRAQKDLEALGVHVLTDKMVTQVTAEGVYVGAEYIAARNIIWAAGNQASPLLKTLDTPLDKQGRLIVEPDLTVPGYSTIFVIGDAACSLDKKGHPLPAIAPTAIQQGRYVARLIRKQTPPKKRKPFHYLDKGAIATIGKHKAVGFIGKVPFRGIFAWLFWGFIHVFYLIGYRNRFAVMLNWAFHYMTGLRGARLIQRPIDDTRSSK